MIDTLEQFEVAASPPPGYHRDEASTIRVQSLIAQACSAVNGIAGAAQKAISNGCYYFNLTKYEAALFKKEKVITSQRRLIDCGADGVILEPLAQETGICDGCSFGESILQSWCARFVLTGAGTFPRECSFLWPYLGGRGLQGLPKGDSGAVPPLSAELYHDFGAMPIDLMIGLDLVNLPPHGRNSQEALCVQLRDKPLLKREWLDAAAPFRTRVFRPADAWSVADCITTGRPVTFGCSYQAKETQPGSNGISSLYLLGGHETFGSGWFTLNGKLGFIKTESWWNALYPGSRWPDHRVTIQTDDGPKRLYPGQCAIMADDWMACNPECWALDAPGTN